MTIEIAEHYGLCFGVRDALKQAEHLARQAPLTILGELVHNPVVRDRMAQLGAREGELGNLKSAQTPQVMITAHGASDAKRDEWRRAGFGVADGTCPLVRHAHDQLKLLVNFGFFPVVIGQPGHVEVQGLVGDFPHAAVMESEKDMERLPFQTRLGVISQTTQPIDKVLALVEKIRCARPEVEVRFYDTVCRPTKDRQSALHKLLGRVEALVIVGGRSSNNTRQLVETSRAAGRMVFHIERAEELQEEWFHSVQSVGITAGTSTLRETVQAVHERLRFFSEKHKAARSEANT